jgi:signal transduction histidine kinase
LALSAAIAPGRFDAPFTAFSNPLGVAGTRAAANAIDGLGWGLAVAAIGAGVAALARRGVDARSDQRRQLRLVLRVGIPAGVIVTADMVLWIVWSGLPQRAAMAVIGLAFTAFAAAVGVAVVRLRLYEERRRIDGFVADVLAGRANPEAIEPLLAQTLGDPSLTVAYALLGDAGLVDRDGKPCTGDAAPARINHEVIHGNERIVVIRCAPGISHSALVALTAQAATALNIARLQIGLRRQLDELAIARSQIASAGEAERRRLQRDLHDGAQARLISVGLALRNLRRDAIEDLAAGLRLDDAVDELAGAIAELRELSTRSSPSLLDAGLLPALAALAEAVPLAVRVEIPDERFSPGVESVAYFVACEGLANAIKHARARNVVLSAERAAGQLVVRVADDGIGGADAGAGRGLAGLRDRVAGLGGRLELDSGPASGTTLTARLPCAS